MHIRVVSPSLGEPTGNAQTAQRWSKLLAALGHTVTNDESGPEPDLLVAIHARKSAHAVRQSRESSPDRPIVLLLSGTDLYGDLAGDPVMRSSVESADRLIVLHERGVDRRGL